MNFFDWQFAREILPRLLDASLTTIGIALAGFAIAVVLGLFLAIGRRSRLRWLSWPITGLIEFVRSTPLLMSRAMQAPPMACGSWWWASRARSRCSMQRSPSSASWQCSSRWSSVTSRCHSTAPSSRSV